MMKYRGKWRTRPVKWLPDREMAGGLVYAVCGWMDGLEGREWAAGIEKVGCFCAASWVAMLSAQSVPYKMSQTAASLSQWVAQQRCARNRLSRVWVRSSWIGCAQGSSYTLHRQSRRHEKGAVSQPLLRRFFRRLLLIFVPPIHPLTIPTVGYLSLGSPQCIVCPKMCRENRGIVQHRGSRALGA